jgi:predicted transcriptional regulator
LERLEKSKANAENKLLLLYILSILGEGINNIALTKIVLEGRYMDFFIMQQYLNELIAGGYISYSEDGSQLYSINAGGIALLQNMKELLPPVEKNRIDRTIAPIKKGIKDATAVSADYIPEDENRCAVKLRLEEGGLCLLSVEAATGSKDSARQICTNWENNTHEIYARIIELLLGETGESGGKGLADTK